MFREGMLSVYKGIFSESFKGISWLYHNLSWPTAYDIGALFALFSIVSIATIGYLFIELYYKRIKKYLKRRKKNGAGKRTRHNRSR